MASMNQIHVQLNTEVEYTGGKPISPQHVPPGPSVPPLNLSMGVQAEGTDYGDIKVENGKLVIDKDDYNYNHGADYGIF